MGLESAGAVSRTGESLNSSTDAFFADNSALQLIGSLASVFVSTGVYCLYRRVYTLPSTAFPVPAAAIWCAPSRIVTGSEI